MFLQQQEKPAEQDQNQEDELDAAPAPTLGNKKSSYTRKVSKVSEGASKVHEVEMDPDEKKKMEECEKRDEEKKEELKKFDEEMADGGFSRLWPYQIPGWVIPIAALGSAVSGACMPVFGVIFSKIMNELTIKLTS